MIIRGFNEDDAAAAAKLLLEKRSGLFAGLDKEEQLYAAEYLARRFYLNPGFSALLLEKDPEALMLSAFPGDAGDCENWYNATSKHLEESKLQHILPYKSYFDECIVSALDDLDVGEILVCLFIASSDRHTERLMTRLVQRCQIHGVKTMYALALLPEDAEHWTAQGFALARDIGEHGAKLLRMEVPEY